jgi:hypothetical protein
MSYVIVILSVPCAVAFLAMTIVIVAGATAGPAMPVARRRELASDAADL